MGHATATWIKFDSDIYIGQCQGTSLTNIIKIYINNWVIIGSKITNKEKCLNLTNKNENTHRIISSTPQVNISQRE